MLAKLKQIKRKSDRQTQKTVFQWFILQKNLFKKLGTWKKLLGERSFNDKTRTKSVSVEDSI